jgi:hypothetical protein
LLIRKVFCLFSCMGVIGSSVCGDGPYCVIIKHSGMPGTIITV